MKKNLVVVFLFLNLVLSCCAASPLKNFVSWIEDGKGQPLVLIHAFPTDQRLWVIQRQELRKHFRVITLDLPGFGDSLATEGQAVTMDQYAEAVNQVLNELHIEKAIVGGESMGGYVALSFLKKYPEKVQGLILSATQTASDTEEMKLLREKSAKDILQNGSYNFIASFVQKALSSNSNESDKFFLRQQAESQSVNGIVSALRGMALREDTAKVITKATVPILIIAGSEDKVINPDQSRYMHALNRQQSRLVILDNVGHLCNIENPNEWNKAVINYFKQ